jgi:uncharacterized protein
MPKTNNLFVDTSGWACYLSEKDPLHLAVTASVHNVLRKRRHLVTTNYILTELVALLSSRYHLPRHRVIALIDGITTNTHIVYIDQKLHNDAWELLGARLDKEWSLVDASSFIVMEHLGMRDALTTDHHFAQAGFRLIPEESRQNYQ